MSGPWLPERTRSALLEADLKVRGWKVWWRADGGLTITAPDGQVFQVLGDTAAQTMRDAYVSAREHAGAALRDHAVGT